MATTLEDKLRTAAAAYSPLATLIESGSPALVRWYDEQLTQGTAFPAVVVQLISSPKMYEMRGRNPLSRNRVQFTIWANDGTQAASVEAALLTFLDAFSATGPPGTAPQPNFVVNVRTGGFAETQPFKYWRTLDAMIYHNETL